MATVTQRSVFAIWPHRRVGGHTTRQWRALSALALGVALLVGGLAAGQAASAAGNTSVTYALTPFPGTFLDGVTCVSAGNCMAVGESPETYGPEIETLSGGTWVQTSLATQGPGVDDGLGGIWCANLTSCIGVGSNGTLESSDPLIETLSGGTWTATTSGLSLAGMTTAQLTSISCLSITSCMAAGTYTDTSGTHPLFEKLAGGTWNPMTAPSPSSSNSLKVDSVQCFSLTSCFAVGTWSPTTTTSDGLLETLSGTNWTETTLGTGVVMSSLWCASATSCLAVGSPYGTSSLGGVTETLSGTTWAAGTMPGIGDGGTNSQSVVGVSCAPSITSCVAIGGWRQPAPNTNVPNTLIETLSGGTWTPREVGASSTSEALYPDGIACPTINSCVGVGTTTIGTTGGPSSVGGVLVGSVHGYWLVGTDGGIFTFGSANFFGSTGNLKLNRPVVGITPTTSKLGYWLVASDGGVFTFGDAPFVGSIPGLGLAPAGTVGGKHLNAPIVGMVPSASGTGYLMVGSDGGVFAFNANFSGSCPALPGGCSGAAVGVAPDGSGNGYWLVTATGHVYNFGDAPNVGVGPGPQGSAITSIVRTPDGGGYWILDGNGNVFAYGDAAYLGGLPAGAAGGLDPATAIFATSDGGGYWISTALGKVTNFGDAPADGDASTLHLNGSIIAATGF
jgi:hypothetical protein